METRERMLEAARDLLLDGGLNGFSMRKVASACGVSATAIYRHFDDKDALLCAAVRTGYRVFTAYLMDSLKGKTPRERFRLSVSRYFDFAADQPRYYALMFMTPCEDLGLSKLDQQGQEELGSSFQFLVDRIAECQKSGDFQSGDPIALAASSWSMLHGLVALRLTGRMEIEPAEYDALLASHGERVERSLLTEFSS